MQAYSNPERETDAHALPDVEIFFIGEAKIAADVLASHAAGIEPTWTNGPGWYYWSCFPGCLPDSDAIGPFETEAEALADAQNWE